MGFYELPNEILINVGRKREMEYITMYFTMTPEAARTYLYLFIIYKHHFSKSMHPPSWNLLNISCEHRSML